MEPGSGSAVAYGRDDYHLLSQNNFADLALHVSVPVFHLVLSNCSACKATVASMPPKPFDSESYFRTLDQLGYPWNTGAPSFYSPRN